jgi:hypothetical protein
MPKPACDIQTQSDKKDASATLSSNCKAMSFASWLFSSLFGSITFMMIRESQR